MDIIKPLVLIHPDFCKTFWVDTMWIFGCNITLKTYMKLERTWEKNLHHRWPCNKIHQRLTALWTRYMFKWTLSLSNTSPSLFSFVFYVFRSLPALCDFMYCSSAALCIINWWWWWLRTDGTNTSVHCGFVVLTILISLYKGNVT